MSALSAVMLPFLGLVFVVTLGLSIRTVRRDHPHHVHTLWYLFSLTLCSVSVLFFYIYKNSLSIQGTPLGGMLGTIAVMFMNASMDVREELYLERVAHPAANSQLFDQRTIRLRIAARPGFDGLKNSHLEPDQVLLRAFRNSCGAIDFRALRESLFIFEGCTNKIG